MRSPPLPLPPREELGTTRKEKDELMACGTQTVPSGTVSTVQLSSAQICAKSHGENIGGTRGKTLSLRRVVDWINGLTADWVARMILGVAMVLVSVALFASKNGIYLRPNLLYMEKLV